MAPPVESVPPSSARLLRQAGAEPIPGYRLIERLGGGGFGEVWKCVAPGGLFKAAKFLIGDPNAGGSLAAQELEAIQRIKSIRHPFLLSLERVEIVDGVLILVMELADRNLQTVLLDCQSQGQPGVPRKRLLGYLREAAEALDVINFEYGLQHLDVKPHNLFVVSNHVKVADFGLVYRLPDADADPSARRRGGATPVYASPETLQGSLSPYSDQYSLAIVYQQLLTGTLPFWSSNPYQLLLKHLSGLPDLTALPAADQPLVARALAKAPEQRFASCMEFVRALVEADGPDSGLRPSLQALLPNAALVAPGANSSPPARHPRADEATIPSILAEMPRVTLADLPPLAARTLPEPTVPEPRPAAESAARLSQPAGVALPGYRFLTCVGRTPLGCLWTVQDPDGRERVAHCLLNVNGFPTENLTRLQTLRHPALPEREVLWSLPGCVVVVSDMGGRTLRDLFDLGRAEGLQGVPRETLLSQLSAVAEALDELHRSEKLPHLGINPTQIIVEDDRVFLEDFGLAPLLWLPSGRPAAPLNPRYSAPELHEPISSPAADQYSLALIYTEMLTGIYPRKGSAGKSGVHRRPKMPEAGSGLHRRPAPPGHRPAGANGAAKVDLDFLPPDDRPVVARALHDDPGQRFPNCSAFFQALQAATPPSVVTGDMLASLPLVTPFACLMGRAPPEPTVLPRSDELAARLIGAAVGVVDVREADNVRYIVHPDGVWEYRFPIRMFASLMRLKLEGFRQQWNARPTEDGANDFAFQIHTAVPKGGFWQKSKPRPAGVEVRVRLQPADAPDANQREAVVRVGLFGNHGQRQDTLLPASAPRIIQSLRAYLQGGTEHRLRERWPFHQCVGVYPVLAHLQIGRALEGRGRDVSLGGVRLLVPQEPPTEFAYLHFHETPQVGSLAVLGRIVRVQPLDDGSYELGFTFVVDGPPGT